MKILQLTGKQMGIGNLILVNPEHGLDRAEPNMLVPVHQRQDMLLCRPAAVLLEALMKEIGGWNEIVPVSAWRSMEEQQGIWDDTIAESGLEYTRKYVAIPGHSEHQTGLAIDLGLKQDEIDFICPEFPYTGICQRFREKAADYGFIERYPKGKEEVTGIGHEPWHFRYVGIPHARIMKENELTLEEYMDFLKPYRYPVHSYVVANKTCDILVSYLPAGALQNTNIQVDDEQPYNISGNNADGFIITEWRDAHANQVKKWWA